MTKEFKTESTSGRVSFEGTYNSGGAQEILNSGGAQGILNSARIKKASFHVGDV